MLLIQKGPMALKPQLELSQTFNDNITYREEDTESDLITTISPGVSLQLGSRTFNYIDFTYFFDRVQYWENDSFSANQHRADLALRFEKSRFLLEGLDEFKNLSSPLGGGISVSGIEVERFQFLDLYKLTYDLSQKTALYFEAFHARTDYDTDLALYDSFTLTGTLGFEYKAFSRTSFFGEVYYGMTENDKNVATMSDYPTARFVGAFIGARGAFTEKLFGSVKAGYEYRTYSGDGGSSGAPVVAVSLTERFSEHSILTLTYARSQQESAQFVGSGYVNDSVVLDYLQHISAEGRLRGNLVLGYTSSDYERTQGGSRQDHLLTAGLTITYDIKLWLRAFGSYNFEFLKSDGLGIQDYAVNRVTLGMQLGY
ncbi:MAG: outer membrane beta-barrel protein [Limisphaerales bacterium]